MARVKVCRLCGHQNGAAEFWCQHSKCGASLSDVELTERSDSCVKDEPDDPDRSNGEEYQIDSAGRSSHGTVRHQAARLPVSVLECPWGNIEVNEKITIGRGHKYSEMSVRLADHLTVSRRHAELYFSDMAWYIKDLGSTNGTYVNGKKLTPHIAFEIHDGDQLDFSFNFVGIFRFVGRA